MGFYRFGATAPFPPHLVTLDRSGTRRSQLDGLESPDYARRMRRLLLACACVFSMLAFAPAPAQAATCSDYDTQAQAQRAADTRDADRDGIYCEALPCPCLKPGGGGSEPAPTPARPKKRAQVIDARITSVVDGDTVKVRAYGAKRSRYTVRLIGVDTPETRHPTVGKECGGPKATAHMKRMGLRRKVTLTTDPSQDTFDRYGRLLAYITVNSTKANLGVRQLSAGWGEVYVYGGTKFSQYRNFARAERRARSAGRGIWRLCGDDT